MQSQLQRIQRNKSDARKANVRNFYSRLTTQKSLASTQILFLFCQSKAFFFFWTGPLSSPILDTWAFLYLDLNPHVRPKLFSRLFGLFPLLLVSSLPFKGGPGPELEAIAGVLVANRCPWSVGPPPPNTFHNGHHALISCSSDTIFYSPT
jgi:hypothetical protein